MIHVCLLFCFEHLDMFGVGCKERKDERNDIVVPRFHKILASGFGVLLLEVEDTTSLRFAWSQSRSKSEIRQRKLQHLNTDMILAYLY